MTLSFSLSNSPDSFALVPGITTDAGGKSGGNPGVDGFSELLSSLAMIKPSSDIDPIREEAGAEVRQVIELPTGNNLPGSLQALPVDPSDNNSSGDPSADEAAHSAKIIPFSKTGDIAIPAVPGAVDPAASTPRILPDSPNPLLAPAAASPNPSHVVLSDRSVYAAAHSGKTQPAVQAEAGQESGSVKTAQDLPPKPIGEGLQVRISAAPESRSGKLAARLPGLGSGTARNEATQSASSSADRPTQLSTTKVAENAASSLADRPVQLSTPKGTENAPTTVTVQTARELGPTPSGKVQMSKSSALEVGQDSNPSSSALRDNTLASERRPLEAQQLPGAKASPEQAVAKPHTTSNEVASSPVPSGKVPDAKPSAPGETRDSKPSPTAQRDDIRAIERRPLETAQLPGAKPTPEQAVTKPHITSNEVASSPVPSGKVPDAKPSAPEETRDIKPSPTAQRDDIRASERRPLDALQLPGAKPTAEQAAAKPHMAASDKANSPLPAAAVARQAQGIDPSQTAKEGAVPPRLASDPAPKQASQPRVVVGTSTENTQVEPSIKTNAVGKQDPATNHTTETKRADRHVRSGQEPTASKAAPRLPGKSLPTSNTESQPIAKNAGVEGDTLVLRNAATLADAAKMPSPTIGNTADALFTTARTTTAPSLTTSVDTFADVERLVEQIISARQVDLSKPAALAVAHREFGALTLTFDQTVAGKMNVEIAAEDADAQRALAAAIVNDRGNSRPNELAAQTGQSQNQAAPTMSDRGGSANPNGTAPGQSNSDEQRSPQSEQRHPHGGHATVDRQASAQSSSDDALYA